MLRELHDATAPYRPPPDAVWRPWFGRALGGARHIVGHCDVDPGRKTDPGLTFPWPWILASAQPAFDVATIDQLDWSQVPGVVR